MQSLGLAQDQLGGAAMVGPAVQEEQRPPGVAMVAFPIEGFVRSIAFPEATSAYFSCTSNILISNKAPQALGSAPSSR
ncbi:hypothetical protein NZK33_14340, partial [Cyanobium sp. FGCU-6]|nr:hypothetical protein [Cyanobium sp. FGCU6]